MDTTNSSTSKPVNAQLSVQAIENEVCELVYFLFFEKMNLRGHFSCEKDPKNFWTEEMPKPLKRQSIVVGNR